MQSPTALPHRQVLTSSAAKRRQKRHQALDREGAGTVAHQGGDAGLLDAENLTRFDLSESTLLYETVNLQYEAGS